MNVNLLEYLQIAREVPSLPYDAIISADLAALFLCTSPKPLPDYVKAIMSHRTPTQIGSKLINYIMRNLREWRNKHTVTSTIDAAVRCGMAFSRDEEPSNNSAILEIRG